jgi:AraC family transcriptional regulator, arabinose operon regulatory protein
MEDYNKIIESLGVRYLKARNLRVTRPISLQNFYDVENTLILVHRGEMYFGEDDQVIEEGSLLFIPAERNAKISYGGKNPQEITYEAFLTNRERYYDQNRDQDPALLVEDNYTYVNFEAKVFDSVNFFASLDIPAFAISGNSTLRDLVYRMIREEQSFEAGKNRIISLITEELVIEILRYILRNQLFVEQLATNSTYFKDPRLINIFAHIKDNLGGDLSNKILARVADVSEDYVGQYFKMLTGINPQDYIEYQRMEQAVSLLRTTKKSIRDIGHEIGYKDTAYFCRRFKMMYGIPAGKMRRRESLMNL